MAAASIASRVLPEPPGPGQRDEPGAALDAARAPRSSSRSRPTKELAGPGQVRVRDRLQRREALARRAGRSRPAPSMSFSRCSPRSVSAMAVGDERAAVAARGGPGRRGRTPRPAPRGGRRRRRSPPRSRGACPCAGRSAPGSGPAASASVSSRAPRQARGRCGWEGEEERVSLRVHLDAALGRAGLAHDRRVLGERLRVALRRRARAAASSSPRRR